MIIRTGRDETEVAELKTLINKKRESDILKFNMEKVEETLRNGKKTKNNQENVWFWKTSYLL